MSKALKLNLSHMDHEVMESLAGSDLRDFTISDSFQIEPLHLVDSSKSETAKTARVLVVFEDMLNI